MSDKVDWRGCPDGTPPSSPKTDAREVPERPMSKGDEWKGMEDGTPPSKPAESGK